MESEQIPLSPWLPREQHVCKRLCLKTNDIQTGVEGYLGAKRMQDGDVFMEREFHPVERDRCYSRRPTTAGSVNTTVQPADSLTPAEFEYIVSVMHDLKKMGYKTLVLLEKDQRAIRVLIDEFDQVFVAQYICNFLQNDDEVRKTVLETLEEVRNSTAQ
jgi:hypothetical protein